MLRLFKTHQIYPVVPLVVVAIAMWVLSWGSHFNVLETNGMPLYDLVFRVLAPGGLRAYAIVGFLLFVSQAIHLNFIVNKHEILYKDTWLPALSYLIIGSIFPQFLWFHPILLVNSVILFAIDKIFSLYKNPSALALAFDSSFLLGLAILFYAPAVSLFIFFALCILLLRPFSWRDWFVGITGFTMPVFFAFLYYFINDRFAEYYNKLFTSSINSHIEFANIYPKEYSISVIFIAILFALAIFRLQSNYFKNVTKSRLIQQLILLFILVGALMVMASPDAQLFRFSILAIPVSIYIAYYFLSGKKPWVVEVMFVLLLGVWVYNYFFA